MIRSDCSPDSLLPQSEPTQVQLHAIVATVEHEPWQKMVSGENIAGQPYICEPELDPEREEAPEYVQESRTLQDMNIYLCRHDYVSTKPCVKCALLPNYRGTSNTFSVSIAC